MDEILKIFGGGGGQEDNSNADFGQSSQQQGGRNREQSLPGGGGVWEFEMPDGGIQEWQQQQRQQEQRSNVYNLPAPEADRSGMSMQSPQNNLENQKNFPPEYELEPGIENASSFAVPGGVPTSEIQVTESTIEGYMKTMGIMSEKVDTCLWTMKYEGGAKDYDVYIELTATSVRIVLPILERVRDVCREKVWYHLLRLNYVTDDIVIGLNKRDEVFMTSVIPIKYISYDDFKKSLTYIFTMVDELYPELLFLSQKTTAVSSFLQEGGSAK